MTPPRVKLDIDATRDNVDALGPGYAFDALERLPAKAGRAETSAHVFLDGLLEAERSGREERRIKTMLKTAKIPTGQTLENFDFAFQPAIEWSRIETLATGGPPSLVSLEAARWGPLKNAGARRGRACRRHPNPRRRQL